MDDSNGRLVFRNLLATLAATATPGAGDRRTPPSMPELRWEPLRPGVDIHHLSRASDAGPAAALLRYAPGAHVPYHRHQGHEHIYVLDGSQRDERGTYAAGTLVVNPPGSGHSVSSPDGCLVLIFWERPVAFADA